jgi:hypothetical protein
VNWRMETLLPGRLFRRRRLAAGVDGRGHSDAAGSNSSWIFCANGSRAERANSVKEPALGQLFCISAFCYSLAEVAGSPK